MTGITRVEGAFAAAAADTDLPGRIEVVEPRNTAPGSSSWSDRRRRPDQWPRMNVERLGPRGRARVGELGGLAVEEAVRRAGVGDEPVVGAGGRQRGVEGRDRLGA